MPRKDYSEDILIQQPTAELLEQELQWDSVFAFDTESFGPDGLLGRLSDREVVLRREVDAALRRLNPGLTDYLIPSAQDVPPMETIIVEAPNAHGPFGAKGAGEPPSNPTAAAIANAIYNATGVRIRELPASPEKVWRSLQGGIACVRPAAIG